VHLEIQNLMTNFLSALVLLLSLGPAVAKRNHHKSRQVQTMAHFQAPEVTDATAEQILRDENKKCETEFYLGLGKCLPGPVNPFNPSVSMCEKREMGHDDLGSEQCRVSRAWMLHGDDTKDVVWWADLQLHVLNLKMVKFHTRCSSSGNFAMDWLLGKCRRRLQHIMQAMMILDKVSTGQFFNAKQVPKDRLKTIEDGFGKARDKTAGFIASDSPELMDLLKRLMTAVSKQPQPLTKKIKDHLYLVFKAVLKTGQMQDEKVKSVAELVADLEQQTEEGSDLDHGLGEENLQEPGLESMLMDMEKDLDTEAKDIEAAVKSANSTSSLLETNEDLLETTLLEMKEDLLTTTMARLTGDADGFVFLLLLIAIFLPMFIILR